MRANSDSLIRTLMRDSLLDGFMERYAKQERLKRMHQRVLSSYLLTEYITQAIDQLFLTKMLCSSHSGANTKSCSFFIRKRKQIDHRF